MDPTFFLHASFCTFENYGPFHSWQPLFPQLQKGLGTNFYSRAHGGRFWPDLNYQPWSWKTSVITNYSYFQHLSRVRQAIKFITGKLIDQSFIVLAVHQLSLESIPHINRSQKKIYFNQFTVHFNPCVTNSRYLYYLESQDPRPTNINLLHESYMSIFFPPGLQGRELNRWSRRRKSKIFF